MAARKGHDAVGRLLLKHKGVDINSKDSEYGKTPLLYAAEGGYEAMVQLLLENGASVKGGDKNEQTVRHLASSKGNRAVMRLLEL